VHSIIFNDPAIIKQSAGSAPQASRKRLFACKIFRTICF